MGEWKCAGEGFVGAGECNGLTAGITLLAPCILPRPLAHPLPACPPARPPQDELSGADVKAMCTEAGLLALRERRMCVTQEDFKKAKEKVLYKKKEGVPEGLYL